MTRLKAPSWRNLAAPFWGAVMCALVFVGGVWGVQAFSEPSGADAAPSSIANSSAPSQEDGQQFTEADIKWLDIELAFSDFPKNAHGQTYGSDAESATLEEMPDLVAVVGDNGYQGFVEKQHLVEAQPSNPKEAIEIARRMKGNLPGPVPVFAKNGRTQLDVFTPFVEGR